MWFGLGGFLVVVGATLVWLVNVPVVAIGPDRLGTIMMVAGALSLAYGTIDRIRHQRATPAQPSAPQPGPPA